MKKLIVALLAVVLAGSLSAQDPEPYQFKPLHKLACTPVKNQQMTGTCWCFSTTSFIESELIRMKIGQVDLSEMFLVRHTYRKKAENYVRRQGSARFGEGGLAHDMLNAAREAGLVPESVYPGRKDPNAPYNHSKLEGNLKKMCEEYAQLGEKGQLPANWLVRVDSLLDAEFGPVPATFQANGRLYTPQQYAQSLSFDANEYVNITSFTHHPFWTSFVLEVPDNFSNGSFYNLPLDDLMRALNYSLQQGYTVEWDADVSNAGFAAKYGMALVPQKDWNEKNDAQRAATFKYVEAEKPVTQAYRQELFDRQETMDDHLMHIVGVQDEAHNGLFYSVKNSWGEISEQKGFVQVSEAYMRLNTISFTVNKNALPLDIRRRLGLEGGTAIIDRRGSGTTPAPVPDDVQTAPNGEPGGGNDGNKDSGFKVTPAPKLKLGKNQAQPAEKKPAAKSDN